MGMGPGSLAEPDVVARRMNLDLRPAHQATESADLVVDERQPLAGQLHASPNQDHDHDPEQQQAHR